MYRYLVSALFAIASVGIAAVPAGIDTVSSWWSKAFIASGLASEYTPIRTVVLVEELDGKGAVSSYERGETRIETAGSVTRTIVVSAEKNGKDATEEWRKRYQKPQGAQKAGEGPPPGFDATPFDPKYAEAITRGASRAVGEFVEVPYSIATESGAVEGVARFLADGSAVSATQTWVKPPVFVSSLSSAMSYAYKDGVLLVSSMKIEGEVSILFVKRRFRMAFEFFDWVKKRG